MNYEGVFVDSLLEQNQKLKRRLKKLERRNKRLFCVCNDLYERLRNEELHREMNGIIDPCSCGGPVQCRKCGKQLT